MLRNKLIMLNYDLENETMFRNIYILIEYVRKTGLFLIVPC